MIDEQIYRRFNHTIAACFVIYFLFPSEVLGLHRSYLIILFWLLVITIETARLTKGIKILGMRDYEKDRIASFVWFATVPDSIEEPRSRICLCVVVVLSLHWVCFAFADAAAHLFNRSFGHTPECM